MREKDCITFKVFKIRKNYEKKECPILKYCEIYDIINTIYLFGILVPWEDSYMHIIDIPIIDYLKLCRNIAAKKGFKWVMVLLARERDSLESYEDIKKYWDSYNDLTADQILFIFSLANKKEDFYKQYPALEEQSWVRAHNPNLLVMNEDVPSISTWDRLSRSILQNHSREVENNINTRNKAVENNTNYISDLCKEYDILESQVPAILLFSTKTSMELYEEEKPIVIPINNDKLYDTIKELLSSIESELKRFKAHQHNSEEITSGIKEIENNIYNSKFTSYERRYLHAKKFLSEVQVTEEERRVIRVAMEKFDLSACKMFSHPIRGCLNQFINLSLAHENIEGAIKQKELHLAELNDEKNTLEAEYKCDIYNMQQIMNAIEIKIHDFQHKCEQEKYKDNVTIIEGKDTLKTMKNSYFISKK